MAEVTGSAFSLYPPLPAPSLRVPQRNKLSGSHQINQKLFWHTEPYKTMIKYTVIQMVSYLICFYFPPLPSGPWIGLPVVVNFHVREGVSISQCLQTCELEERFSKLSLLFNDENGFNKNHGLLKYMFKRYV